MAIILHPSSPINLGKTEGGGGSEDSPELINMDPNRLDGVSENLSDRRREGEGVVRDVLVEQRVQKAVLGWRLTWGLPRG